MREATILARIERQRGTLDGVTELDLAYDSLTEITDQNHVGGLTAVVELAVRACVGASSRVLDVGAGLGGSARCLALSGCSVHCVELTPVRCEEGRRLTARVGLDRLVTWTCGDVLSVELPRRAFDVVWGQGAWFHISDKRELFRRVADALVPGGRVAFEDAYRKRPPRPSEEAQLAELERLWAGRFLSREEWLAPLAGAGFDVTTVDDLTGAFVTHFERLTSIARTQGPRLYPAHEVQAFELAVALTQAGVVGCSRIVAKRS